MAKAKSTAKKKPAPKQARAKPGPFDQLEPLPAEAWGYSRVKPGFASSERAAQLLGLGYPHIILASTEPFTGDDKKLVKLQDSRVIPRDALERLYRLHHECEGKLSLATEVERVLQYGGAHAVFFVEALFGAEATARAFVEQLAAYPVSEWSRDNKLENYGWSMIRMLAFTLWRVPAGLRTSLLATLEDVFQRVSDGKPHDEWWRPVQALDLILHGRAGVERCGRSYNGKLHLSELLFATDDPAWLADSVIDRLATLRPVDRAQWDIQFAVIGGPKVLAALKKNTARFKADQKKSIASQLSLCA